MSARGDRAHVGHVLASTHALGSLCDPDEKGIPPARARGSAWPPDQGSVESADHEPDSGRDGDAESIHVSVARDVNRPREITVRQVGRDEPGG